MIDGVMCLRAKFFGGTVFSIAVMMAPAAAGAGTGTSHTPEERCRMFRQSLARRAALITENCLGGIATLDDWKRERPEKRRELLSMLGLDPLPKKTPLRARVTGGFDRPAYRVENIVFESKPGLYVTGNLYLPKQPEGKVPVVVYLTGHSPWPAGSKAAYQLHGIWFARNGYAAFLLDNLEFGEVPGYHHGTHDLGLWYWQSLGYTPAGPEVWNAIRALDYLETRPEIDARRVAVTGGSGGGAITWYAAAVDERFRVAVPERATWTVANQVGADIVDENCDCIYFTNTHRRDLPLAAALIAPRPLKILSARRDGMFPPAGYHEVYRRVRRIYELYGAAGKVAEYDYDAPHRDILPFRKQAAEWINRWLRNDRRPYEEGEIRPEKHELLRVLPAPPSDAINGNIDRLFIPTPRRRNCSRSAEWETRRGELLAALKENVFGAFPKEQVPFDAWKQAHDGWTGHYADTFEVEFNTERDVRVTGWLFVPRDGKTSHPALIYVKGKEDVVYEWSHDRLIPALGNHVVLVLKPRAVDYPLDNYQMATLRRSAALVGATVESMQVWDILRSIDYLTGQENLRLSSVSVFGRKQMGALAFYAAALDDRIDRVILDDPPTSHWQGPALLNVLRLTDLPEAAALVAPREIVSLTPLPDPYGYTFSIYALYRKPGNLRWAGSLYDALRVWKYASAGRGSAAH